MARLVLDEKGKLKPSAQDVLRAGRSIPDPGQRLPDPPLPLGVGSIAALVNAMLAEGAFKPADDESEDNDEHGDAIMDELDPWSDSLF